MEQGTGNKGITGRGFMGLAAWEKADNLASLVFRAVRAFSPQNRWLADQMARSAVSVPANIAEGYGRGGLAEYLRFLDIARGSLAEIEYFIHFAKKERLIDEATALALEDARADSGRLLYGLWLSLKNKSSSSGTTLVERSVRKRQFTTSPLNPTLFLVPCSMFQEVSNG